MSFRKLLAPRLALPLLAAVAAGCGATVPPGAAALKYKALRDPALQTKIHEPGFYFLWRWNKMIVYDITTQTAEEQVDTLTADSVHVPVTVTVAFRPRKSDLYALHTQVGPDYYVELLGPTLVTLVRGEFSHHLHNDLANRSPMIEKAVMEKLQQTVSKYYLLVDRVTIQHINYDPLVTQAISRKIATRQQAEQKKYELEIANRDAEIARTAAQGRGDAMRIQADGEAAATLIKGRAQAQVQSELAKTLTSKYLQLRALDNPGSRYFFVPTGKDNLPIIVDAGRQ
jgi:regulator of protease activity HflC (stomatin/prohibitin superfamily)